jgi:hypothetical protein
MLHFDEGPVTVKRTLLASEQSGRFPRCPYEISVDVASPSMARKVTSLIQDRAEQAGYLCVAR